MTQKETIDHLADKCGMSKADAKKFMTTLNELAKKEVKKNGEFTVPGFGKVVKVKRKARKGRNPATGEEIKIPAKTTVKFRVGKAMKDAVQTVNYIITKLKKTDKFFITSVFYSFKFLQKEIFWPPKKNDDKVLKIC